MSFFFTVEKSNVSKQVPTKALESLGCLACPLQRGKAINKGLKPRGSETPDYYFLSSHPKETSDIENLPFSESEDSHIFINIPKHELRNCRFNYIVRTFPLGETITPVSVASCKKSVVDDILASKPKLIIAVGKHALDWLVDDSQPIQRWRGRIFPVTIGDCFMTWCAAVDHPSHIERNQRTNWKGEVIKSDIDLLYAKDFERIFRFLKQGYVFPTRPDIFTGMRSLSKESEFNQVLDWLERCKEKPVVGLDYETQGLRPYASNNMLLTASVGDSTGVRSFPLFHPFGWSKTRQNELERAFGDFLYQSKIKVCHNMKFEMQWSAHFFGKDVLYDTLWEDTYAQAYLLDERPGTHNLDFLVYLYFGFWLKRLNPMDKTNMLAQPLHTVLEYNNLDTKWTVGVYLKQEERLKLEKKLYDFYFKLLKITTMLTQVEMNGVLFDFDYHENLKQTYQSQLKKIEQQLSGDLSVIEYQKTFNTLFNPASPTQIIHLFDRILGKKELLAGEMDSSFSTGEKVLSTLVDDIPLAKHILDYRGVAKKLSTYIDPMLGNVFEDQKIHTNFNPYVTRTGRLCVAEGTLISVQIDSALSQKPIEHVKIGDKVLTYTSDLKLSTRNVIWSGCTGVKQVLKLEYGQLDLIIKEGQIIKTHKGTLFIEQLKVGDQYCHDNKFHTVFAISKKETWVDLFDKEINYHFYRISLIKHSLYVTMNHPIRLASGCYKPAGLLNNNDLLLCHSGISRLISKSWHTELVPVYDLGVEDTHNFIANSLCVSNSSSNPNLQNLPSKTGKEPRGMIIAPPKKVLVCCDYGQIEARLIGAASQDRAFCDALWNDYDVHMEWGKKIAYRYPPVVNNDLENKKVLKAFRGVIKNKWVFPAFYGAGFNSISLNTGIPKEIVKELFGEFWEQFSDVRKWQYWILERYQRLGYAENFFGRRRHAPLTTTEIPNTIIQSSASDICTLSMEAINKEGIEVVFNVHDEIGFYIPEYDLDNQVDFIVREMTRPKLGWLNIPISVEVKMGFDWFNMEEMEIFKSTDFYPVNRELIDFKTIYDLR